MKKEDIRKQYGITRPALLDYLSEINVPEDKGDIESRIEFLKGVCKTEEEKNRAIEYLVNIYNE